MVAQHGVMTPTAKVRPRTRSKVQLVYANSPPTAAGDMPAGEYNMLFADHVARLLKSYFATTTAYMYISFDTFSLHTCPCIFSAVL
jgi:hypothetical protein